MSSMRKSKELSHQPVSFDIEKPWSAARGQAHITVSLADLQEKREQIINVQLLNIGAGKLSLPPRSRSVVPPLAPFVFATVRYSRHITATYAQVRATSSEHFISGMSRFWAALARSLITSPAASGGEPLKTSVGDSSRCVGRNIIITVTCWATGQNAQEEDNPTPILAHMPKTANHYNSSSFFFGNSRCAHKNALRSRSK